MSGARGGASRRPFYVALALVAVLGFVAISWAMNRSKESGIVTIDPAAAAGIKAEGQVMGSASAPVEIIEFADFECPGCGQFATVTEPDIRERLVKTGQARFRIYTFQVTSAHQNAVAASLAAECAADQNKFWEMHDAIFVGQPEWSTYATSNPKPVFARYGERIGLDMAAWNTCYDERRHVGRVAANAVEAQRLGVGQTPTIIVGDRKLPGAQPYDVIKALVDSAAARAGTTAAPAAPADSGATKR